MSGTFFAALAQFAQSARPSEGAKQIQQVVTTESYAFLTTTSPILPLGSPVTGIIGQPHLHHEGKSTSRAASLCEALESTEVVNTTES